MNISIAIVVHVFSDDFTDPQVCCRCVDPAAAAGGGGGGDGMVKRMFVSLLPRSLPHHLEHKN